MAMGRRHDGLLHRLAIINGIGLHQDSRDREPTDKDGNLLTVPERYGPAGNCSGSSLNTSFALVAFWTT